MTDERAWLITVKDPGDIDTDTVSACLLGWRELPDYLPDFPIGDKVKDRVTVESWEGTDGVD